MLTRLIVNNFKRFEKIDIDLGSPVVFIGPNNSGKTTALQALALWETAYHKWLEKRSTSNKKTPSKRPGITINRKDLISIPVPVTKLLWKDRHTHTTATKKNGSQTDYIFIEIAVEGIDQHQTWNCGFEFYYANEESFYCRPITYKDGKKTAQREIPDIKTKPRIAFLPPMSGLTDREFLKQHGELEFLIGQGQTAQVLRNLCYKVYHNHPNQWEAIVMHMQRLFGLELLPPEYTDRSEIVMSYKEQSGVELDISASGRGIQQTLLLLAHLYANPGDILLLDEPDAHLEIIRQRQNFNLLVEIAGEMNSQIIAASHSEVVLNEAAGTGTVVAFVGNPHTINSQSSQVMKSLTTIGFDQYYQAELKGWVLYLEDASDLAILKAFADKLRHPAAKILDAAFVNYISSNLPSRAREHFYGIREAKKNFLGIAIFDHLDKELDSNEPLIEKMWEKREIENYLCRREVLLRYAEKTAHEEGPLFTPHNQEKNLKAMNMAIEEIEKALDRLDKPSPWSDELKVSDEFLAPLFRRYSQILQIPLVLRKNKYHMLVDFIEPSEIDFEVQEKLNAIENIAEKSKAN